MTETLRRLPSLCGCGEDLCTCCAVCWCHCVTAPQLYEKTKGKGTCLPLFILLLVLLIFYHTTYGVSFPVYGYNGTYTYLGYSMLFSTVYSLAAVISTVVSTFIVCQVRQAVRANSNIAANETCGELEDCCCAFWCNACTQCQLFRFLGITAERYSLVSPTGETTTLEAAPLNAPLKEAAAPDDDRDDDTKEAPAP